MRDKKYNLEQFVTANHVIEDDNIDPITGLFKYAIFIKEAEKYIKNSTMDVKLAVYYLDITNFKLVNEFYGLESGDALLGAISNAMQNSSREGFCGRFFSDNFVKIFEIGSNESIEDINTSLVKELEDFIREQNEKYPKANLGAALGLYAIKAEEKGVIQVIDKANSARKSIKARGLVNSRIYNNDFEKAVNEKQQLELQIKKALKYKEFDFYLQPKINIETGKIVGAEALVRWIQNDGSVKEPGLFLPIMEETGSIVELDFYIYEEVFKFIQKLTKENKELIPISLNVSRRHLNDLDFASKVHQLAIKYNVLPVLIEFEITENIFIQSLENAKTLIKKLNDYGYQISVDDFGSGFSSLNILKDLNFDVLKIDRKFISGDRYDSQKNKAIMSSVIEMAKKLNMGVILEGVETLDHVKFMKALGCTVAQGYFFDRPLTKKAFLKHVADEGNYQRLLADEFSNPKPVVINANEYKELEEMTTGELGSIVNRLFETLPSGIVGINAQDGRILFTNNKVFEITGYSKEEILEQKYDFQEILKLKNVMKIKNMDVKQELFSKGKFYNEYPITKKSGEIAYIRVSGGYANSAEWGNFLLCTIYDITNEYEVRKEIEQSQRTMDEILKSIHGGVARLVVTDKFRVEFGSDGFYELCGYNRLKSLLNPFYNRFRNIIYHEDIQRVRELTDAIMKEETKQIEHRIYRGDGTVAWVEGHISKVYKRNQEVIMEVFYIDTTNQRTVEEKQRKFYTTVYDSVLCGIIQYEKINGKYKGINANSEAINILGYTDHLKDFWQVRTPEMLEFIHPDDKEDYLDKLESLIYEGDTVKFEHRIFKMDETVAWIQGAAKIIRNQDGNLIVQSTFFDSTYYLQQQKKFEENYRQIAKIMKQTIFEYDVVKDVLTFSIEDTNEKLKLPRKVENFSTKLKNGEIYGLVLPLTQGDYKEEYSDIVTDVKRKCLLEDGSICWVKTSFFIIRDNQGNPKTYTGTVVDITESEKKNKALKQMAQRDQLTGLYNKATFRKKVTDYIEEDGDEEVKVLFFIDLDNFKLANDTYGHPFGDKLLNSMGKILQKSFRKADVFGRVGGDEFMVLMKNVNDIKVVEAKAKQINEEFHKESKKLGFEQGSCSIGVTIEPIGECDYDHIVSNGDYAMYIAKQKGKATYHILDFSK